MFVCFIHQTIVKQPSNNRQTLIIMSEIMFSTDTDMINTFSLLSIILLICIVVFKLRKDSYYIIQNPQIESVTEKLSYLFYGYIFILQGGILYHVNYFHYSLSGSESDILYTEESHPIVAFIILLLFIVSLLMTCISVANNNKITPITHENIDMVEYSEEP